MTHPSTSCDYQSPTIASYPLDHPDADIILRSSDSNPKDYRVFKLLLSLSSPFFNVLFTLPQPSSKYGFHRDANTPIIQMSEDHQVLDILLGYCYPLSLNHHALSLPHFTSLTTLQRVAEAAMKFEMDAILKHIRRELVDPPLFLESQPLRVYAIANQYGWAHEMKEAARFALRHPMPGPHAQEFKNTPPPAYRRLERYHRTCGEVAKNRALIQLVVADSKDGWIWMTCPNGSCPRTTTRSALRSNKDSNRAKGGGTLAVCQWWSDWLHDVASQLTTRPHGKCVLGVGLMSRAASVADGCSACSRFAREDLKSFALILSEMVEKDVASIELELDPDEWMSEAMY